MFRNSKKPHKTWVKLRHAAVSAKENYLFYHYLEKIGYRIKKKSKNSKSVIRAFQRRYRTKIINGKIDKECLEIAKNLIKRRLN